MIKLNRAQIRSLIREELSRSRKRFLVEGASQDEIQSTIQKYEQNPRA